MSLSATIAAMAAAGCSMEQVQAVVRSHEAEQERIAAERREARREGGRKRQEAKRTKDAEEINNARNGVTAVSNASNAVNAANARDERDRPPSEVPPKDNNQTPLLPTPGDCSARSESPDLAALADEFYDAYPKKVEPRDAKSRFIRLAKAGADPVRMIEAAKRFAEAHRLAGTEKQFIKAPAVWLNKGGWESEDLPEARAGPRRSEQRRDVPLSPHLRALQKINDELPLDPPDDYPADASWPDASGFGGRVVGRIGGPR